MAVSRRQFMKVSAAGLAASSVGALGFGSAGEALAAGRISIDPIGEDAIQPASLDIWDKKYRLKAKDGTAIDRDVDESYQRVARALADSETEDLREHWYERFLWALRRGAIPAGRYRSNRTAAAGNGTAITVRPDGDDQRCTSGGRADQAMRLRIRHRTVYHYTQPVRFLDHRLLVTPRATRDVAIIWSRLRIDPAASLVWSEDAAGNTTALALIGLFNVFGTYAAGVMGQRLAKRKILSFIYLMRSVTDGRLSLTSDVRRHLDLCLDCRACETACPSGVRYAPLIEEARAANRPLSLADICVLITSISAEPLCSMAALMSGTSWFLSPEKLRPT